jgi:glycosyltransferase involved in cell wall biosynthesis
VDIIVSTGPPHSMHLIALGLKQKLNIPWLADFRDPWTNIDFYNDLKLTHHSDLKHHKLEKQVIETADRVVVIGNGMAKDLGNIFSRKYDIITNGYDEKISEPITKVDSSFSIAHIGSMVKTRNPDIFWEALSEIITEQKGFCDDLEIKLIGQVDFSVRQSIESYKLEDFVTFTEYLSHEDVRKVQSQSQVLLLLINNTPNAKLVVTGKIFEYMNSGRPILCIGPNDGDAANILSETKTGYTIDYKEKEELKNTIEKYYTQFKKGILKSEGINLEKYSRKNLTKKLSEILNELT